MSAAALTNTDSQDAATAPKRRRGPGRPFAPGVSGNPSGSRATFRRIVAELERELGGNLPPSKRLLVEQLADLKMRARKAGASEAVRISNSISRLLAQLGLDGRPAAPAAHVPLRERLAAEAAALDGEDGP
jgi:hypothetical protein